MYDEGCWAMPREAKSTVAQAMSSRRMRVSVDVVLETSHARYDSHFCKILRAAYALTMPPVDDNDPNDTFRALRRPGLHDHLRRVARGGCEDDALEIRRGEVGIVG